MDPPIKKRFMVLAVITSGCMVLIGISLFLPLFVVE